MDAGSQRVLQYLTEVEEAAEDVLTTKQQVPETRGDTTRIHLSQRTEVDSFLLIVLVKLTTCTNNLTIISLSTFIKAERLQFWSYVTMSSRKDIGSDTVVDTFH